MTVPSPMVRQSGSLLQVSTAKHHSGTHAVVSKEQAGSVWKGEVAGAGYGSARLKLPTLLRHCPSDPLTDYVWCAHLARLLSSTPLPIFAPMAL